MATRVAGLSNRDQLLTSLAQAQAITDDLFRIVNAETLYDRPIAERHRIVFLHWSP